MSRAKKKIIENKHSPVALANQKTFRMENLVKIYNRKRVVDGVSFHIQKGEIVGLLGPNGAGKTTSFYMSVGFVTPDEGTVFIDGQKTKADYDTYQERIYDMDIYYSHEKEADDLIIEYIKENPFPNRLTLITSDKKILKFARQFKVKYFTSEKFSDMIRALLSEELLPDPDEKPIELISEDIDHWHKVFTQHQ